MLWKIPFVSVPRSSLSFVSLCAIAYLIGCFSAAVLIVVVLIVLFFAMLQTPATEMNQSFDIFP